MPLQSLKLHLASSIQRIEASPPKLGRAEDMVKTVRVLQDRYHNAGMTAGKNKDRIQQALRILREDGVTAVQSQIRYVCWGLNEPFDTGSLLQSSMFPTVLDGIESGFSQGTLTNSAWRGLLHSYFSYQAEEANEVENVNWQRLRSFLSRSLDALQRKSQRMPRWLLALLDNRNLLTDRPCQTYTDKLLSGDENWQRTLQDDLNIPEHSWFWREVILERVRGLCDQDDLTFVGYLHGVLATLEPHPLLVDDALCQLLPRYQRHSPDVHHEGLRDFAVQHWGTPNLFSKGRWGLVAPEVKSMVQAWLVRDDLKTFFEVLQEDQTADQRRFDFWLRYHKQMTFIRIALGRAPYHSPNPDFKELRDKRRDRVCYMYGGDARASAIIMKIGHVFFVEFSHTGSAAYGYANEDVGFPLNKAEIGFSSLKDKSRHLFWGTHQSNWEDKFSRELSGMGIYPDDDQGDASAIYRSTQAHRTAPPIFTAK